MNARNHLLERRRNQVLLSRHVRAVSLRHVPHQQVSISKAVKETSKEVAVEEKNVNVLSEPEVKIEESKKEVKTEKQVKQKKTAEEIAAEKEAKKLAKEEKKKQKAEAKELKKQQKIQDKEDQLNRLIDEPVNSLPLILTNPIKCMEQLATVDYATLSTGKRVVLNAIKWVALCACIGILIENLVNVNPFGFSRMNFTSTAIFTFKIAIYGYVFEILAGFLIAFLASFRKQDKIDRARLVSICTIATPFKIILFVISAVAIKYNNALGIALFVTSLLLCILLTGTGIGKCEIPPRRCLLAIGVAAFVGLYFFGAYFSLFAPNVVEILKNIMNI